MNSNEQERTRRDFGDERGLTVAAGDGDARAIVEIERRCAAVISSVCRRFANRAHEPEDLRQILRERLFVAAPGDAPAITAYSGHGYLENWLRITAVRLFLDLGKRKDRPREALGGDEPALSLHAPDDLENDAAQHEHEAAIRQALRTAIATLSHGDRQLLHHHLVHGQSIDELGDALRIHRATAARRIVRAKQQLIDTTRAVLEAQLALTSDELDELLRDTCDRFDISLGDLLAEAANSNVPAPLRARSSNDNAPSSNLLDGAMHA